jgi:GR25 family glycosyltransferase involved in LPS biosynthesis
MKIGKCYYINLADRDDRRRFIEAEIKKSRILSPISIRFEAVNGYKVHPRSLNSELLSKRAIKDVLLDTIPAWGLSITQGALGVYLSYLSLFEDISRQENPCITIEDDCVLSKDFDEMLSKIKDELPADFDICYLGRGEEEVENKNFSESLMIPTGKITCLPGLIISPKGAEKLLNDLKNVSSQIDTEIYSRLKSLKAFASKKRIVEIKNAMGSNIQGNLNCAKKYKKQNYIFSTLACGEQANDNAINLALDLDFFKQKLLVITDTPEIFASCENVTAIKHSKNKFSYNDKLLCFEEGLKIEDAVVYIDADCRIFYEEFNETYANFFRIIEPGLHPSWNWGKVNKPDGIFYGKDAPGRVDGYSDLLLKKCSEMGINIDDAFHFQEGILALCKEDGKEINFLNIWKSLANCMDEYEENMQSEKIGQGEGNLIGLAASSSAITMNTEDLLNAIGEDIKYNFYGMSMDHYISQFPKRKMVQKYSGLPTHKGEKSVEFKDKKIELSFKIFKHNEDLSCLQFEWNNNQAVDFLDHEFKIHDKIYHFNSDRFGNFYFKTTEELELYHSYDWYGEKKWEKIQC